MTIATAVTRFRRRQAEQFSETATVTRPVGPPAFNRESEEVEQDYDAVTVGLCKIRPAQRAYGREVQAGEREVVLSPYVGKWPVDTPLRVNDVVTVTASLYDADLAVATFRVAAVHLDGWQIARVAELERIPAVVAGSEGS